jgi:hypothetical protein
VPALRSTESFPYAGHRCYIDLTNANSARDLVRLMGANRIPIVAHCHRVTRGVEIRTTFVGSSDSRHRLEGHETNANGLRLASVPEGRRGPAPSLLRGREPEPGAASRCWRRTGDATIDPSRNVGVVAVGWRTAPRGPAGAGG